MNEKKLSRPLISLIVSIALIIVGIAGSFILQTNSGKTTIRNVTIESESGHTLAMDVYIPENATAETPAPAIFVQHGGNNNKEEMQHYCIELARRGYVAIGVDMYGQCTFFWEESPCQDRLSGAGRNRHLVWFGINGTVCSVSLKCDHRRRGIGVCKGHDQVFATGT